MIAVGQRAAVAAIRSQAVPKGALGPKLTEGVSGSGSGDDRRSENFASPVSRPRSQHGGRGRGPAMRAA